MAAVEMRKLTVIGLNSGRAPFIYELMHLGVVEINSQEGMVSDEDWMPDIFRTSNSADVSRLEGDIIRVSTALEAIVKYDPSKKPLLITRQEFGRDDFIAHMNQVRTDTERNMDKAIAAYKVINDGKAEINQLRTQITGLQPWVKMDIPLEMNETEYVSVIHGMTGAKVQSGQLITAVTEGVPSAIVQEIGADKQQKYFSFIVLKEEKDALYEALRPFNFSAISMADQQGTPAEAIHRYENRILEIENTITENEQVLTELAPARKNIEYLYDLLVTQRDRARIVGEMLSTDTVFYFDGWLPARAQEEVEELLKKYEFYYDIQIPDADEEVPVLLHNSSVATPFEAVTNMYSLPSRKDIDPTTILAPFYFIFFGMMLSDAAYGIILSALCFFVLKKYKPEGTIYKMFKMFFYCGISTFIWGALFGGWFGNFFTVAAETLLRKEFTIQPIWFNPLEEPMRLLIFSLILGAIHLFIGMGIQAYMYIRDGQAVDAICDIFLWYVLLIGLVLFAVGGMAAPVLTTVGKIMSIVGAVGIFATGGRKKKGIIGKITGGFGALYGITSYLSDVLSYSRLLALGLATGVVAQVINTLGSLAGGGVLGAVILTVALVFGTIFNLAI
ncbi:MAG: V-type ATP synthase subunit I, partial [Anaerotignum sp.]|nr:V-type ATP synthase subunit I [Anaerotignum sp.]